jgi:hypothetical protein
MEAAVLVVLLILVVVILVGSRRPLNGNHAGLRFEVGEETDPDGSRGRRGPSSFPLEVLEQDRADVDREHPLTVG